MTDLRTPLRSVVGDKTAKVLASALDLTTAGDLLAHYPRRYAERGSLTDLADLRVGDHVTVLAEVVRTFAKPMRNRRGSMLEVVVTDGRRKLALTFFNQPWRERQLKPGTSALFAGKVTEFRGKVQLANPDYQLIDGDEAPDDFAGRLIPVYPATAQIASWQIATAVRVVLDVLDDVPDPLPAALREARGLMPLLDALRGVHRPDSWDHLAAARTRLKWDEAFLLQTALAQRRRAAREQPTRPRVRAPGGLVDAFDARLPFDFTEGQRAVTAAIEADLARTYPMHRLLQGEVGSGKTVVALRAMLTVVDSGGQAALLAPTEVLAQQHHRNVLDLLGPVGRGGELDAADVATRVVLLTGSTTAAQRRERLAYVASGEAGIVVGTHALLEAGVEFRDLALVVVDEQHRFGVQQRDTLRAKGVEPPHLLVMTATPIPRTVAMTVYGDLEVSTLAELPKGRAPIRSAVVPAGNPTWYARVWERVATEVAAGRQAFVVCPRIDADEEGGGASVEEFPVADLLPGLRVEKLHGRMPPDAKDAVMRRFAAGQVDVLVSTTVVEVGVDVPNATVMVVLDADRFGISQLHQLRGRVGRGSEASWCLLVTGAEDGTQARERVQVVADTLDGFELAQHDLRQRREGDVLGTSQSGRVSALRMLELLADADLIRDAREEATALVEADPALDGHPALAEALRAALDEERAEYLEKA